MENEVNERFGVLPNFFLTARAAPDLMKHLWAFAKGAYLDLPIPSLFKERLFVYLSRFCEDRYCVVRHCGFLLGRGRPAGDPLAPISTIDEAVALLKRPYPTATILKKQVKVLEGYKEPMKTWPEPDQIEEIAIFHCAAEIFLKPNASQEHRFALKNALGESNFELLLGYLAFIRTAHFWTLVHPELEYEEDVETLLANHQTLSKRLLDDPESGRCHITPRFLDELNELKKEKKDHQQLKESQAKLIEALKARDEFLSVASHELKSPLTTLGLATELMEMEEDPDEETIKNYLSQVSKYHLRLTKLVEDMLDTSKFHQGQMRKNFREIDFAEILRKSVAKMMPDLQLAAGGKKPRVNICDKAIGLSDADQFEQLVTNLLSNAIKYGGGKPINITLYCNENQAHLSIQDFGKGISKEKLHTIFSRFERGIDKNEVSGLGLGLYLVKQITDAHKGTIKVESEIGQGSNFIVELPLRKSQHRLKGQTILIAEDDKDILDLYSRILSSKGYFVKAVSNGQEAIDTLLNLPETALPDCILLDLMMPVMDGRTFLETLESKYLKRFGKIPVLVSSALNEASCQDLPLAPKILSKPMKVKSLLDEIEKLVSVTE